MFVEKLFADASDGEIRSALDDFLKSVPGLKHTFEVFIGRRNEFPTGHPATFVDIYPKGWGIPTYEKFGGLLIRIWRVGTPSRLIYGLWVGTERAEQIPARRASKYVRSRLGSALPTFEVENSFQYVEWRDALIEWAPGSSVRAVSRQLDCFASFKRAAGESTDDVERDLTGLLQFLDNSLSKLNTPKDFAIRVRDASSGLGRDEEDTLPGLQEGASTPSSYSLEVNWALADEPIWGNLKGLNEPYQRAIAALRAGKHVILLGPPGSGKTELAEFICSTLEQAFRSVTATSEWGAFETIGGYLPSPVEGNASTIVLDFNPGLVVQALENREWLILDELNRADLDKCFGELFTLLGGGQKSVRLPFKRRSQDETYRQVVLSHVRETEHDDTILIPSSWRIIGTMNTTDKASLYQLSYAFMRRFAFINVSVPTTDDYNSILISALGVVDIFPNDKAAASGLASILATLFASTEAGTLRAAGIEFGPALALDVIRYLASRSATLTDSISLVEEALELLVFPQMEGMRQKYPEITTALNSALSRPLSGDADRSLQMWTGHYE
ncbi:MAG: hypothetical protein CFE28_03900 [Alphaproteobacteria bacterium PA2]|nr:MAG: hypothetical protein CFE28_03900 [Alphaproteobacteria bacterium PA2]